MINLQMELLNLGYLQNKLMLQVKVIMQKQIMILLVLLLKMGKERQLFQIWMQIQNIIYLS